MSARWWGIHLSGNSPTTPDDFTLRFYQDDGGGLPGALLATRSLGTTAVRTDSGLDITAFDDYEYQANFPAVSLAAATPYHFSVSNNTAADTDDDWYWSFDGLGTAADTSGSSPSDPTIGPWFATSGNNSFELSNTPIALIPDPSRVLFFGLGVLAGHRGPPPTTLKVPLIQRRL